jgi:hypothetical protein
MPRVSAAFFLFCILSLLTGMLYGMHMAKTDDFVLAPVHAHLNLLGGVLMAIYGTFYALTQETYSPRLAWINFLVSALAVLIIIPALAMLLSTNNDAKYGPVTGAGSGLAVIGLLIFAISVVRELVRKRA